MKHTHVMKVVVTVICIVAFALAIHFFGGSIIPFIKKMHGM